MITNNLFNKLKLRRNLLNNLRYTAPEKLTLMFDIFKKIDQTKCGQNEPSGVITAKINDLLSELSELWEESSVLRE